MSYNLTDAKQEPLGQLATNLGMANMSEWIEEHGGDALWNFVALGSSLLTDELFADLDKAVAAPAPPDIHATLVNLRDLVRKADIIAIISNGIVTV